MKDLVIVSMHEKGFPQADYYQGFGDMPMDEFNSLGCAPDAFFTMSKCQPIEAAKAKAAAQWPNSVIVEGADEEEEIED
jgi:hypothetical protein